MSLGIVGVSYRGASLQERERAIYLLRAFETDSLLTKRFFGEGGSFVLLTTCHRAEIYYFTLLSKNVQAELVAYLSSSGVCPYAYQGQACFKHLFTVTSGVDSLIFGETEIQGQVKRAYIKAHSDRDLPFTLHFLFQKALKEGKAIRTCSRTSPAITIESVVEELLVKNKKTRYSQLLFVGYSAIHRRIARGLRMRGFDRITFCSRTPLSLPYPRIARHQLSFQDPYDVIFFGTSDLEKDFPLLSLTSLSCIENRVVFDFNVPRTFSVPHAEDIVYLDMDVMSACIEKKCVPIWGIMSQKKTLLVSAARKQWAVYEKKCSQPSFSPIRFSCSKLLIL